MTDIDSSLLQVYCEQVKMYPLLSFEEEQDFARRIQQGELDVRQKLVEANLRLVIKIARSYLNKSLSLLDIIQEGNIGLIYAAERYDPERQVRFSTYASWWIKQHILRYLESKRRFIRLPHRKEQILRKIQKSYHELAQKLKRMPNVKDIAGEIGITEEEVEEVISAASNIVPLTVDDPDSAGVLEYHQDYTYNPEHLVMKENSRIDTMAVLNCLKSREKKILMYRYQFFGSGRQTLKVISNKFGISPETVRQIEMKALRKIRVSSELHNYFG